MPDTWSLPSPISALPPATKTAGPQPQPLMLHSGAAGLVASSLSPCSLQDEMASESKIVDSVVQLRESQFHWGFHAEIYAMLCISGFGRLDPFANYPSND